MLFSLGEVTNYDPIYQTYWQRTGQRIHPLHIQWPDVGFDLQETLYQAVNSNEVSLACGLR